MVHYDPPRHAVQTPPPVCPKCGSHRTEVVGSTDAPPAIMLRCNACGERSSVPVEGNRTATRREGHSIKDDLELEIEVIQAVGRALGHLPDVGAQRRVMRWLNDCYQPWQWADDQPAALAAQGDPRRGVDSLAEAFDLPGFTSIMH